MNCYARPTDAALRRLVECGLAALLAVHQDPLLGFAAPHRHQQCIKCQFPAQRGFHRPAYDLAGIEVQHHRCRRISLLASSSSLDCCSDLSGEAALTHLYRLGAEPPKTGRYIGHGITAPDNLLDCLFLEFRREPLGAHGTPSYAQRTGGVCLPDREQSIACELLTRDTSGESAQGSASGGVTRCNCGHVCAAFSQSVRACA